MINANHFVQNVPGYLQSLRSIRIRIYIIRFAIYQLRKIYPHTPSNVISRCSLIVAIAMITDIAEPSPRPRRAVVLEKLRLYRKTRRLLTIVDTIAHISQHDVVCIRHLVHSKLV